MDFKLNSLYDNTKNIWNITIEGEIDIYNSSLLKEKLNALIQEHKTDLHINCDKLEYIDSTGLGSLVSVLKKVKQYNGNISLCQLKPNVAKVFKITELNKVFVIEGANND